MSTGQLPAGWKRVKFGEVVSRVTDSVKPTPEQSKLYIGLEHMRSDSYAVAEWGSDVDLDVTKTPVLKGDVLFARRNTHLRRCAVAPFDTIFSPDGYVFRTRDPAILLQQFLLYVVASNAFMDFAVTNSAGTHSKRVKWTSLAQYEFALPPLDEQQRIVDLLRCADNVRVCVRSAVLSLQKFRESNITERVWRADWESAPIAEVWEGAEFFDGDWIESKDQASEGIRLLQLADIGSGRFMDKSSRFISQATFERLRCSEVFPGDLLISRMADPIGRSCVVPELGSRAITVVDACVVRDRSCEPAEAAFWLALTNSSQWVGLCERAAGGTTRTRVSRTNLERISIPRVPVANRTEIGRELMAVDALQNSLDQRERQCCALMSVVRERLLGGRDVH